MKTSVGKGFIYLSIVSLTMLLSSYIIYIGLGRILGPEKFGIIGVVIFLAMMINQIITLGIQQTTSKFVSENEEKAESIKRTLLKFQFVFAFLCSLIFFLLAKFIASLFNDLSLTPYIRASSLIILFAPIYVVFMGYLNGLREFKKQAILSALYSTLRVIIVFGLVLLGFGIMGAIFGFSIAFLVMLILNLFLFGFGKKDYYLKIKKIICFMAPLMVFYTVILLVMNLDLFLIKALSLKTISNLYAGYYTAAATISKIPFYVLGALNLIIFPLISKSTFRKEKKTTKRYINLTLKYGLIIITPLIVLISSTSKELISLLYSEKYILGSSPLSILIFGLGFFALFLVLTTIISGSGHPKVSMGVSLLILMVSILLNLNLIPKYNLVGAAIATTISAFLGVVACMIYIKSKFKLVMPFKTILKILLTWIILYFISKFFFVSGFLLIIKYALLTGGYFFLALFLKILTKKDLLFFKKSFMKVRNT